MPRLLPHESIHADGMHERVLDVIADDAHARCAACDAVSAAANKHIVTDRCVIGPTHMHENRVVVCSIVAAVAVDRASAQPSAMCETEIDQNKQIQPSGCVITVLPSPTSSTPARIRIDELMT